MSMQHYENKVGISHEKGDKTDKNFNAERKTDEPPPISYQKLVSSDIFDKMH